MPGVRVTVSCGDALDEVVLRSYCIGAAHMALGWVASEGLAVDEAGEVLDEVVLRSYCIGAAHMALGWVTSEGIAVDERGEPLDLTIRSFGILRAVDTPAITIEIDDDGSPPRNGSDAVFAAVAAATWRAQGCPSTFPTGRILR